MQALVEWIVSWTESPWAPAVLFVVAFEDSVLLPVPPEPLQIAMSLSERSLAIPYAALVTVASLLGATLDYYIGRLGGRPVAERFVDKRRLERVTGFFRRWDIWGVSLAAFTPLPYPVFAVVSGIAELRLWRFLAASAAGRGARFFGIGAGVYLFGDQLQTLVANYLSLATLALGLLILAIYLAGRYLERKMD